jgi:glutamate-5-semialdehyde dehydrogenase
MTTDQITELVVDMASRARKASLELAALSSETKNCFLDELAERLIAETDAIMEANAHDLEAAKVLELSAPMTERLTFTPERIAAMVINACQ